MKIRKMLLTAASLLLSLSAQAGQLNVMAYNIMQLSNLQDWDQAERAARLPQAIADMDTQPDVILISEAFNAEAEQAMNQLANWYPYQTPNVGQDCSGEGWDALTGNCSNSLFVVRGGVTILSKYPILTQKAHIYNQSLKGSWDYQANKGFAYAKIDKNGEVFHLIGTHLQATHDGMSDEEHQVRLGQLSEIKHFIDNAAISADEPVIIGGDMNVEWSRQDEIKDMKAALNGALRFTEPEVTSFSAPHNWFTKANAYHFDYDLNYNTTLDYILWSRDHAAPTNQPEMKVIQLTANDRWYWDYLEGEWPQEAGQTYHDGYYNELSDHYPVMVQFEFK
ncbi:sphingomyelin phosphodiesterase [Salinivibrio sp. ES.052]|uniref:sphingomyelin phosphodiesterase n=1 Tax=Salinivibrio sp. ES.052 TaxID=1882823 RepID=UPI00092BA666|nr:sphingomyelin phosphodiesterase [Salinivibrio sp. ES.052]SIO35552.1 phospholipase C [Salinivibrio sp. ES.052]